MNVCKMDLEIICVCKLYAEVRPKLWSENRGDPHNPVGRQRLRSDLVDRSKKKKIK